MSKRVKNLPEYRMERIRKFDDVYETIRQDIENGVIKPLASPAKKGKETDKPETDKE